MVKDQPGLIDVRGTPYNVIMKKHLIYILEVMWSVIEHILRPYIGIITSKKWLVIGLAEYIAYQANIQGNISDREWYLITIGLLILGAAFQAGCDFKRDGQIQIYKKYSRHQ